MIIKVCVGSSCHLKGSYDVILTLKEILKKYDVEDIAELQASFCLGYCSKGVNVKSDELSEKVVEKTGVTLEEDGSLLLHNITMENVEELFVKQIYPLLEL